MSVPDPRVAIIIPARYGSTRLPGKPLAEIAGKSMIQHVYERAKQVRNADVVVVATDDSRILEAVRAFGGECVMTSADHESGTDRLGEVMTEVNADIYVNLQGDEPLVRPSDIETLISGMLSDNTVQVGTLCHPIERAEANNPNTVKVVLAENGDTIYFSRSPIPYPRDEVEAKYLKHVGIYAYRLETLKSYSQLKQPMLEQAEKLEQLRLLYAGLRLRAWIIDPTGPGVDTEQCLAKVRCILEGREPRAQLSEAGVQFVITDVDGVLTDGGLFYDHTGEALKRFHVRDGMGIRLLEEIGVQVAVLSGRDSPALRKRISDLGIKLYKLGVKDKAQACEELIREAGVVRDSTATIGDDCIDLPAFNSCGLSYAVADAPSYVKQRANVVLKSKGGEGAFREVADAILIAKGKRHILETAEGYSSVMSKMAQ